MRIAGTAQLIDAKKMQVVSVTGEQKLDYGKGIFVLNAPKAKAVSGFLNTQGIFDLGDVEIRSENEYATIELVSMDGRSLDKSGKILLQVGTVFRPSDWKEEPAVFERNDQKIKGFKITNTGRMPWMGMPAKGSIFIKNKLLKKATQLDAAGYGVKRLDLLSDGKGVGLRLPEDAFYILLEK